MLKGEMKYSFLEFDEKEVARKAKNHCWQPVKISDVFENGFHAGAYSQHSIDVVVIKKLLNIINLQNEALKFYSNKTKLDVGEMAAATLAAVENKLGELK